MAPTDMPHFDNAEQLAKAVEAVASEPLKQRLIEASRILHWLRGVCAQNNISVPMDLERAITRWQHEHQQASAADEKRSS